MRYFLKYSCSAGFEGAASAVVEKKKGNGLIRTNGVLQHSVA